MSPNEPERALEVGPGSGVYLPVLAELYGEVIAADIEHAYLDHVSQLTKKYTNIHLKVDDITASQLRPGSFDLILCTEVIEHIADSAGALHTMHRLLKPNGTLILSTPQRYSTLELASRIAYLPLMIHLARKAYREPVLNPGHINLLTRKQVCSQLAAAGFVVRERHLSGLYVPIMAELMGRVGLRLQRRLETVLRRTPLGAALWTQYYVAEGNAVDLSRPVAPEMTLS